MLLVATIVTCVVAHATPYTTADNPSSPADRGATHEVTIPATDTTVRAGAIHTHLIRTEIHFRWDDTTLDTLYMGNYKAFARLRKAIDSVGLRNIDSIIIVSQSSPEGPFRHNQELSQGRAAAMRSYMEAEYPMLSNRTSINPEGESWEQLREYIANDPKLKNSSIERLLRIIDDNSVPLETKKWRIAHDPLRRYLYTTYYPRIRNSRIFTIYVRERFVQPTTKLAPQVRPMAVPKIKSRTKVTPSTAPEIVPPVIIQPEIIQPEIIQPEVVKPEIIQPEVAEQTDATTKSQDSYQERDSLTFALKTNMLYDVATALNCEVEIPIGRHFSVMVEDVFPWWEKGNKYCMQMWEMGIEGRYWFRNNSWNADKLRGHFVGAYGMSSKYDFQWDRELCYQGEYWSVGLTYGYALKVARHLNFEFSLSVGYLSTAYRHYYPADDYSVLWRDEHKQGRLHYFGPTKAKVSLVIPIHVPYNKKRR